MTVVPATATAEEILALRPDGVFLSNGPGDPAETGKYAVPTIQALLETKIPLFGICLGHQLLGLAVGARTVKMPQGHHGANHPVKDFTTGKVEIVSMNHGFAVDRESLPANVDGDACLAVRRLELRRRADRPPGLLGAVPPRGLARPARQPLSLPPLRRPDGGGEGGEAAGGVTGATPRHFRARNQPFQAPASLLASRRLALPAAPCGARTARRGDGGQATLPFPGAESIFSNPCGAMSSPLARIFRRPALQSLAETRTGTATAPSLPLPARINLFKPLRRHSQSCSFRFLRS